MGSGLTRLGTGSVSKDIRQLYSHNFQILYLKTYTSNLFVTYLILNELQAKSLEMENTFQRKLFQAISWVSIVYEEILDSR